MENERFEEADVYAALGMEVPAEQSEVADQTGSTGAKGPELTDPAGAKSGTQDRGGVTGSEIASPPSAPRNDGTDVGAESGRSVSASAAGTGDGETDSSTSLRSAQDDKGGEMSREERARQAAARRERETQQRIDAALQAEREKLQQQHRAELEEVFSKAGMTDRYNDGKPIKTMEDFRSWSAKAQAAGLSRRLQEGKLTAEDLQAAVDNAPAVKAAKAAMERLEAQEKARQQERHREEVEKELDQIRQMDPSVSSLSDILSREGGEEFSRLVTNNGLSFVQAFKLTNGDRLAKAQAMAAAEGAARQQHGKDHMRSVAAGGGAVQDVPRETVAWYRQLDPEMSMEDIRKDYARRMPVKS